MSAYAQTSSPEARMADAMAERLANTIREMEEQRQTGGRYGEQGTRSGGWGQGYWGGTQERGQTRGTVGQRPEFGATEAGERFLPLVGALLPAVVSSIPSILDSLHRQNRDIMPVSRDPQQIERDFLSVLGAITPVVVQSIPQLVDAFSSNRDLPRDDEEVSSRWFAPLAMALVPHLADAVPSIVSAFAGGRRDISTRAYDPEVAQRFLGPLIGSVLSTIPQHLPEIISAFTGRQAMYQRA